MERNKPFITIAVPVYNGEKFIIEALESIKVQICTNFECHVINNASTDKTKELVSEFIRTDNRFFLHNYKEFTDIARNWNRTVHYISEKAKYFKLVQADDIIFPDSLKVLVDLMESHPSTGIASSYRLVDNKLQGFGMDYFRGNCRNGKEILLKHLKGEAQILGSNTQHLYRVEDIKKLPFYPDIFIPEDIHMDTRLAYELLYISDLAFAFNILGYSRRHPESGTVSIAEIVNTFIHSEEIRLHRFREFFPELNHEYAIIRRKYAYFILKKRLFRHKKAIQWHNLNLRRKFTVKEYISGIIWENRFSQMILKKIKKRQT
jgi:glycosyltransferase involved in cell wall biosynthesis